MATVFHSALFFSPRLASKSRGAQQPAGHIAAILLDQTHQHRHVGVAAAIILEIFGLAVEMELAQDRHDPAPWRARRRCPAWDAATCRRISQLPNSPARRRPTWRPCSAPRCRNGRRACASAARSIPTGSGSLNCTSRPIPARRSARPRSWAKLAADRNTSRRRTCRRRRATTGNASRPHRRPSTWPGSAKSRSPGQAPISSPYRRWPRR